MCGYSDPAQNLSPQSLSIQPHFRPRTNSEISSIKMADASDINNNTNVRKRGRPKGSKNKNKQPQQQRKNFEVTQNHTIESLRDKKKKKRPLSHDSSQALDQPSPALVIPSKKATISPRTGALLVPSEHMPANDSMNIPATAAITSSAAPFSHQTSASGRPPSEEGSANVPTPGDSQGSLSREDSDTSPDSDSMNSPLNMGALLQQLINRMTGVEDKLSKLDSMEHKLNKLDVIESKTNSIVTQIKGIQSSVDSLDREVESVKTKVCSNEERMEQEIAALKTQLNAQDDKVQSLAEGIKSDVLTETKKHFNAFTYHFEHAFIKEQAATRRLNLIFTGIPDDQSGSELSVIQKICKVGLGLDNINIDVAFRTEAPRAGSSRPSPVLTRFKFIADRKRVWQAKKRLP